MLAVLSCLVERRGLGIVYNSVPTPVVPSLAQACDAKDSEVEAQRWVSAREVRTDHCRTCRCCSCFRHVRVSIGKYSRFLPDRWIAFYCSCRQTLLACLYSKDASYLVSPVWHLLVALWVTLCHRLEQDERSLPGCWTLARSSPDSKNLHFCSRHRTDLSVGSSLSRSKYRCWTCVAVAEPQVHHSWAAQRNLAFGTDLLDCHHWNVPESSAPWREQLANCLTSAVWSNALT
jgi:hypothetical protein